MHKTPVKKTDVLGLMKAVKSSRTVVLQSHGTFLTIEHAADDNGLIGPLQLFLHLKLLIYDILFAANVIHAAQMQHLQTLFTNVFRRLPICT